MATCRVVQRIIPFKLRLLDFSLQFFGLEIGVILRKILRIEIKIFPHKLFAILFNFLLNNMHVKSEVVLGIIDDNRNVGILLHILLIYINQVYGVTIELKSCLDLGCKSIFIKQALFESSRFTFLVFQRPDQDWLIKISFRKQVNFVNKASYTFALHV